MQPEHLPNTNTFTCQGLMPKVREKFKTSSNFLKNAFLGCGLLLTSILNTPSAKAEGFVLRLKSHYG